MKRVLSSVLAAGLVLQAGPVLANLKIGYIDSDELRQELPEFKTAQRQLDQLRQQIERELGDRRSKLLKLEEDFRKQELLLSESKKKELRAQYEQEVRRLQEDTQKRLGPDGELFRKNAELSTPIFEKINTVLQTIGEEEGYDFIFDVATTNSLVYAPGKYDLTQKLIARLKEERKQQKGK